MITIDFDYSDKFIKVRLNNIGVKNIIFYVLCGGKKIYIKHLDKNHILLNKSLILNKRVRFQFYYRENNVLNNVVTDDIIYNLIDKTIFSLVIGADDYHELKRNGYFSVDKTISIILNNKINWVTPHHNFNFNLNSLRFLSSYWREFTKSYNQHVLDEIYGFISQYYHFMNSGISGRFINYDMALGIRALHISLLYIFKDFLTQNQQEILEEMYSSHLKLMLNPNLFKLNNHGVWLIYGLRVLVFIKKDINTEALKYCQTKFSRLLNFSFNKESISVENSPFYHQYNLDLYNRIPVVLFPSSTNFKKILVEGRNAVRWMIDKNGSYYQIGDTEGKGRFLLDFKNVKPIEQSSEYNVFSKLFNLSGYFFVKTTTENYEVNSELVFYNTADTTIHKHVDSNSFLFFYEGIEVFADAGKYAYEYTDFREYFVSSYGHNTLFLEKEEFSLSDINLDTSGFINNYRDSSTFSITSNVEYINKLKHQRKLSYKILKSIDIFDTVENFTDSDIVLNFIFGENIELINFDEFLFIQYKGRMIGKIILDCKFDTYTINYGSTEPYRGWISKSYKNAKPTVSLELVFPKDIKEIKTKILFFGNFKNVESVLHS